MNFSHEKLIVYQRSLEFIEFTNELFKMTNFNNLSVYSQLDRASTSISLNIAEDTGKFLGKINADSMILQGARHLNVLLA